jgi:hypothetical protein
MAIQDQLANLPLDSDEAFFNYGGTDIAAGQVVAIDTSNVVGDGTHTLPGIVLPTTGGNPTLSLGITMEVAKANAAFPCRVRTEGVAVCTAQGAITAGATVDASATTAGMAAAHTAGKASLGFARSTAADGDPVMVYICPSLNA